MATDPPQGGRGSNPNSWNNTKRGAAHHRWADRKMISSHGYVKVRVGREHPLADRNGYAYEHLLVWVSAGREMPAPNELLHHGNEDKSDNRLSNLELKLRTTHGAEHIKERRRDARGRLLPKTSDGVEHNGYPA